MTSNRMAELESVDTDKLGNLARKQIADEIQVGVEEKRAVRPLLVENDRLQGDTGKKLEFFERQAIDGGARPVSEGGQIPEKDLNYSSIINIGTHKYGISDSITEEAIQDGRVDVVEAVETEIADALANQEDSVAVAGLAGGERKEDPGQSISGGSASLTEDDVIHVDEVLDTHGDLITDYKVHREPGDITNLSGEDGPVDVTYWYINTNREGVTVRDADTSGEDTLVDEILQKLRNKLAAKRYDPDLLVMNDTNLGDIMDNKLFIDSAKYGGEASVLTDAEIGRLFGMRVIVDSQIPDKYIIAVDTDVDPAVFLVKQDVQVETDDLYGSDKQAIYATQRYGAGLVNSDAVEVLNVDTSL